MLLFAAGLMAAGAAQAHRGHHTLSVVTIAESGDVVVTHTLSAHDTEPELVALAPEAAPSVDDPQALKALEDHLAEAFIVNGQGLRFVSHDFRGDDLIFVYSGKLTTMPTVVTIDYGLFPSSEEAPEGVVNIRLGDVTRSLHFHGGDAPKSVTFAKKP
ncbi:hypothetical protein ABI_39580 [Asticcacaulis biprosthecium C19]|uniref:Uncharacterized protein n=1 Tax=Asticcacaulis biprosthecium C19 TaxID=715226 RepID=F4QS22_9CAUL|nr:DUF6702 family protein [Asticcacaulis biprosthecium]EGF89542.1 hypothetical protein ABI_39580 [Asticcacaulis biprosthecium C19]